MQVFYFLKLKLDLSVFKSSGVYTLEFDASENILINQKPISIDSIYNIVASDYMAGGGDNFFMLKESLEIKPFNIKIRDVIIHHLKELNKAGMVVRAFLNGRVQNGN